MKKHDLARPLSRRPRPPGTPRRPLLAPVLIAAGLLVALAAALWVAVVDDPDGGRSVAVATIEESAPASTGSVSGPASGPGIAAAPPPPTGTEMAALPSAPSTLSAEPALVEPSEFGPLPRVSPDGRRPREAYSRPAPAAVAGEPRIVLVVGGLGLSQTGTQNAIESLPEDVTLAFAPYGASLQRWVDKAREEGHEVLLQVPLEPVNYPAQNPGDHTLLVSNDRRANERDLRWVLARTTSYAGVMNYMGGRFTGDEQALLPVLGEIGQRGLFFLDDGSSPASQASRLGEALQVPVVSADIVLDLDRSEEAIAAALGSLEALARQRGGLAVGVASAFPASVALVAEWADAAAARGVAIVPASAAAMTP